MLKQNPLVGSLTSFFCHVPGGWSTWTRDWIWSWKNRSCVNYNLIGISQCLIITINRCKILKTRPI